MPRFDKTGPRGMGPLTGRGRGRCIGSNSINNSNQGINRVDQEDYENKIVNLLQKIVNQLSK